MKLLVAIVSVLALITLPSFADAPQIITDPASQTLSAGDTLALSVSASGTDLTYQWTKNGTDILDATNSTFTVTNILRADAGTYAVTISNISVITSQPAIIAIIDPVITSQPIGGNATIGTR